MPTIDSSGKNTMFAYMESIEVYRYAQHIQCTVQWKHLLAFICPMCTAHSLIYTLYNLRHTATMYYACWFAV